ncbi:hypothetical protein D3C80_1691570 [compost metagenome]
MAAGYLYPGIEQAGAGDGDRQDCQRGDRTHYPGTGTSKFTGSVKSIYGDDHFQCTGKDPRR